MAKTHKQLLLRLTNFQIDNAKDFCHSPWTLQLIGHCTAMSDKIFWRRRIFYVVREKII